MLAYSLLHFLHLAWPNHAFVKLSTLSVSRQLDDLAIGAAELTAKKTRHYPCTVCSQAHAAGSLIFS